MVNYIQTPWRIEGLERMFVWPTSHMGMLHPSGDQRARSMAEDFVTYAEASLAGVSYNDAKDLLAVTTNQAETRKSFYEELSLLYVPHRSNTIILTPLGNQLFELLYERDFSTLSASAARQATAIIVWAMCRSQINRPQSRGVPRPTEQEWRSCDIRPYAAAWAAIRDLGGEIYLHEFMGPLRRLHQCSGYSSVVEEIRDARAKSVTLATSAEMKPGNYSIYWRSHLSVAEQVLNWSNSEGVLRVDPKHWDIVCAALQFQEGCSGSIIRAIQSHSWSDADDYFMNVAGAACPPYLAGGSPSITTFEGQALANLADFTMVGTTTPFSVTGGPELCHLPLKMPCYHPGSDSRLLRIDAKQQLSDGTIELRLGLGRPIVNLQVLKQTLASANG